MGGGIFDVEEYSEYYATKEGLVFNALDWDCIKIEKLKY